MIIKASKGFQDLGIKKGDAVCVLSTNNTEYAITFFALASFGAILQATNPLYTVGKYSETPLYRQFGGPVKKGRLRGTLQLFQL